MTINFFPGILSDRLEYETFGFKIQQNNYALLIIDKIFELTEPQFIIEFGTRTGGLSIFLKLYAINKNIKFITYDSEKSDSVPLYKDLFKLLDIDFRCEDITSPKTINEVKELIKISGRTILFCDAQKTLEFNIYSDFLKNGDLAMCHDYFHDENHFKAAKNMSVWNTMECKYSDLKESIDRNNMSYFLYDYTFLSAWGAFIKNEHRE